MSGLKTVLLLVGRGVRANLGRLALTLISVFLGVAAVSGSFVLADSLRTIFNQVAADSFAGVDAQVRRVGANEGDVLPRFDASVLERIQELPGVEFAEGGLFAFEQAYALDADGEIVRAPGPPVFTVSWVGPSPVSALTLLEGEAPTGQQVALDQAQTTAGGFELGDQVSIAQPDGEIVEYELAGIVDFGNGGTAGAYFLVFDLPTTQRLLGADSLVDSIVVNGGSTPSDELLAQIEAVLPDDLEVVSGEAVVQEQQDAFGGFIDIFGNILLGFAIVVLFVSTFIIYNTFAILVTQRTRQIGLLRSIGAGRNQVRFLVVFEAVLVGLIASTLGLVGGLGVAQLLKWLFSQGGGFPDGPLQLLPRTIIASFVVGLAVTTLSALIPALRAARVAPLEAIRNGGPRERSRRWKTTAGAVVLVPGLTALLAGMFLSIDSTTNRLTLIGVGGALTFIGTSMLSALFAGPVAEFLGRPVSAIRGVTGRIARDNASRNPQRTAATSTALMIGLALITGVAVLTSSILATFDRLLADALAADLFVFEEAQNLPFSASVVGDLNELDEVSLVSGFTTADVLIGEDETFIAAYDSAVGDQIVNMDVTDGDIQNLGTEGIAVLDDKASDLELGIGDSVAVTFDDGAETQLEVQAIFADASAVNSDFLIDRELNSAHATLDQVDFVGLRFASDVDAAAGRAAVDSVLTGYPQLTAQDNAEFQEEIQGQISQLQVIVSGLLALCLVVAFFGIVNTMALSVLERTREIGLLRAVGMTQRQLKSSIYWEAAIVCLFGSGLGVVMGLLLGVAAVTAIPDEFISDIGVPWIQLVVFVVIGTVIGIIAAFFPAARAARLNVLDAISHE